MMVVKFCWQVIVWTSSLKCLVIGSYVLFLRGTLILCAKLISSLLTVLSVVVFFLGGNVREPHWIHAFHSTGSFPVWLFNHTVFIGSNFYWPDSSQFLLARFEVFLVETFRWLLKVSCTCLTPPVLLSCSSSCTFYAQHDVIAYLVLCSKRNVHVGGSLAHCSSSIDLVVPCYLTNRCRLECVATMASMHCPTLP